MMITFSKHVQYNFNLPTPVSGLIHDCLQLTVVYWWALQEPRIHVRPCMAFRYLVTVHLSCDCTFSNYAGATWTYRLPLASRLVDEFVYQSSQGQTCFSHSNFGNIAHSAIVRIG